MPVIAPVKRALRWLLGPLLAGCTAAPRAPAPVPVTAPSAAPPAVAAVPAATPAAPSAAPLSRAAPSLTPPRAVRTQEELRRQAAERLVLANPDRTFTTTAPTHLLTVIVLEVEVRADGSVRRVNVIRKPRYAPETLQMAIDAVHRAAPFGDVRRMPEPWKFTETFLFEEDRRFKPLTLN
ncbi:hypothetical protein [Roseateles sp. BYS96W]|uniref:TonB C-terminal domain-containing protein n=1 Tax=Pelomonas nitida TaxID=3299027 RepID=A0ABW7GBU0_9BURK